MKSPLEDLTLIELVAKYHIDVGNFSKSIKASYCKNNKITLVISLFENKQIKKKFFFKIFMF